MKSTTTTGFVLEVVPVNGSAYCRCSRPGAGPGEFGLIPVMELGGGDTALQIRPTVGAEVIIETLDDGRRVIIGAMPKGQGVTAVAQANNPSSKPADARRDVKQLRVANAGAEVVVDGHGAITQQPAPGQPIRQQLSDGSVVAIMRGEASDYAVLTNALIAVIAERDQAMARAELKINELVLAVQALAVGAAPVELVPSGLVTPTAADIGSDALRLSSDKASS